MTTRHAFIVMLIAAIAPVCAHAQDAEPAQTAEEIREERPALRIGFRADQTVLFDTDLRGEDGDVFTSRSGVDASIIGRLSENVSINFGINGEFSHYDFDGADTPLLTADDALEDAYTTGLRLTGRRTIDETWSVVGGGFARAGLAEGADFDDAISGGGFIAAGYEHSEDFSIDFGVLATTRLEDDALVVPYIALEWKIDDRLTLTTTGLGARLDAKIDERWSVFLRGRYESRSYRLDDDFAPLPGGVVRDESFPLGVGVEFSPSRKISLLVEGGVVVGRELEFFSDSEDEIRTIETDSGAFLGIRLVIAF